MKAIDSLLKILVQQGGTELCLVSDQRPQMFKSDVELPLTIPPMSAQSIRDLLDDLWTSQAAALRQHGQLSSTYSSAELGQFVLQLVQADESTLEARFRRNTDNGEVEKGEIAAPIPTATAATGTHTLAEPIVDTMHATDALPASLIALLSRAASKGASDIHLSPHGAPIVRINGVLQKLEGSTGFDATPLLGGPAGLAKVRSGGSIDLALDVPGAGRLRVNVYASDSGLCAAVRFLKREAPTLAELNLPPLLETLVDLPHGLVIACGPTGCGKSTTLAALVQHALRARVQLLLTLEDPIEYVIRPMREAGLVRQRQIGTHVPDFATGLRDALREDPDMILVGEMRDPETINLALTAAETGHLVFASLHSRTAASAIERIVDTYPPERQRQVRVQLADSLRAVISQHLLPTADGGGRIPAVEVLRVTFAVANLIREGRTPQIVNALQAGANDGMLVLERCLTDLVSAKRIRRETALEVANDPATLNEYLRAASH